MMELENNQLVFRFPEAHEEAILRVNFQRTLRIPDDNREYPFPPGLGRFPLRQVDDHADRLPDKWREHGGVFLPMYQAEALWVTFGGSHSQFGDDDYPFAVRIAAGKVNSNAVNGEPWRNDLWAPSRACPGQQDYLVVPEQPWRDGFNVGTNTIRQFVAMTLGAGSTAGEQLTGEAAHGGIQIIVYPLRGDEFERCRRAKPFLEPMSLFPDFSPEPGLAPGGLMRQNIYKNTFRIGAWHHRNYSHCFVHIASSAQYRNITGEIPPTKPPTAADYSKSGLPWFELYDVDAKALDGAPKLANLDSVAAKAIKNDASPPPGEVPLVPQVVKTIQAGPRPFPDGKFCPDNQYQPLLRRDEYLRRITTRCTGPYD